MPLPTRPLTLCLALSLGLTLPAAHPRAEAADTLAQTEQALIDEVTATLRKQGGAEPDARATVDGLNRITAGLFGDGRYAEAQQVAGIAYRYAERVLGAEHPDTLVTVNNLALLYKSNGRYGEAEPLSRRALAARERVLGAEHPDTLVSVDNLASLYRAQGRYGEAEPLLLRALKASERVLGAEHPDTHSSVNSLATLYESQGRYGEAEPLFRRALEARKRVLGAEHPDTLVSVHNLTNLYRTQGRYGEAEPLLRRALETSERVLGAEHPQTLASVNNLALLYQAQGRYGEAEPLFRRALEASQRMLGAEHPQTLGGVNNLALLYQAQGRYGDAEPLYRGALEASERVLGAEHPQTLGSVNNLAFVYQAQGRYGEAEPLFRRALEASERVLGETHPDTIEVQFNLAATLVNLDRLDAAIAQLRTSDRRLRTFVRLQLDSTGSEQVRRARVNRESQIQDAVFTLALAHPDSVAVPLAADILLRWKRLAGAEEAAIARLARTSRDPRVLDLAGQIRDARSALTRLANGPQPDPKAFAAGLRELEDLEVKLATFSQSFRGQLAGRSVEWKAVWDRLRPGPVGGTALVELRAYQPFDFKTGKYKESRWLALILARAGSGNGAGAESGGADRQTRPRLLDLGPVAATSGPRRSLTRLTREGLCLRQLDADPPVQDPAHPPPCAADLKPELKTSAEARRARLAVVEAEADQAAAALYRTLFGSLDAELAGFDTLYLAPDGELDLVPFARLRLPDGRWWIERQQLRELGTGRDLLPDEPAEAAAGMLALGGVDYDRFGPGTGGVDHQKAAGKRGGETRAKPVPAAAPDAAAPPGPALWLAPNTRLRDERRGFEPLARTAGEVATVGGSFWDYSNRKAVVLTGAAASEQRLRAITDPPLILHLATHGFFLDARAGDAARPLTLAGLALAGANLGLKGDLGPGGQDGLLWALEAQDLNLEGTRLVVLSACDTGRGAVDPSEGVYGLVRAFQTAGAGSVLMSLWPLNDALAAEFMGDFYRTWLKAGPDSDPAAALRATQLEWLGDKTDARRRDPGYWAPYVLVERR